MSEEKQGWLSRLSAGLKKTSAGIGDSLTSLVSKRTLDEALLADIEDGLIAADMGTAVAASIVGALRAERFAKEISEEEVRAFVAERIAAELAPYAVPLAPSPEHTPFVVLVVGVNGNGKTTTIGKLAASWRAEGKRVTLAACDTFRAAAVEQLAVWANRAGCDLVRGAEGADPASVAYQALEQAQASGADILLVDTAGRLHNKDHLMAELEKIIRVMQKRDVSVPHAVIQVLDATTGQNALAQASAFRDTAGVSGFVVTKLDGTAKAGVILALARQLRLPIHAIGVGEGVDDLQAFSATDFARALVGG